VPRGNYFQLAVKSAALCTLFDFSTVGGSLEEKYPDCHLRDTVPAATHFVIPAFCYFSALDWRTQQKSLPAGKAPTIKKPGASRAFRSA